jgi:long-subunit fatty acid transport protein
MRQFQGRSAKFTVFVIALLVVASTGAASAQTLLSLYELERGARPAALGGAFSGLADDAYAVVYNPAALAFLDRASAHGLVESRFGQAVYGSVLAGGTPSRRRLSLLERLEHPLAR